MKPANELKPVDILKENVIGTNVTGIDFGCNEIKILLNTGHEIHAYASGYEYGEITLTVDLMKREIKRVVGVDLDEC
ncbi:hypothetical protein [Bacillus sp. Bos-x628]|uniref:hypothetical protein n=1 Tax=Bacillus maqinnsis TaxID=3229854 RepID=UPI00338F0C42